MPADGLTEEQRQKKAERAKRFGLPDKTLDEERKKRRLERFGMGALDEEARKLHRNKRFRNK